MHMNVQILRLRMSNLTQDIKQIWHNFRSDLTKEENKSHVMTDDEKLDEALKETFPASDPTGQMSKSFEDKALH